MVKLKLKMNLKMLLKILDLKKKLKEDADLTYDDIDLEDMDYCVDYPENLEGKDNG